MYIWWLYNLDLVTNISARMCVCSIPLGCKSRIFQFCWSSNHQLIFVCIGGERTWQTSLTNSSQWPVWPPQPTNRLPYPRYLSWEQHSLQTGQRPQLQPSHVRGEDEVHPDQETSAAEYRHHRDDDQHVRGETETGPFCQRQVLYVLRFSTKRLTLPLWFQNIGFFTTISFHFPAL